MNAPSIFGVPMQRVAEVLGVRDYWEHGIGDWKLIVCTAISRPNGYWWSIEALDGSTLIASNYRQTPELAAKAIEEWLENIRCRIVGLQAQGRTITAAKV